MVIKCKNKKELWNWMEKLAEAENVDGVEIIGFEFNEEDKLIAVKIEPIVEEKK